MLSVVVTKDWIFLLAFLLYKYIKYTHIYIFYINKLSV